MVEQIHNIKITRLLLTLLINLIFRLFYRDRISLAIILLEFTTWHKSSKSAKPIHGRTKQRRRKQYNLSSMIYMDQTGG